MTASAMRHRAAAFAAIASFSVSACSKPDRPLPLDSALPVDSAAAVASDGPIEPGGFPIVPDGMKLIMSGFGQIIVPDNFQDSDSGFVAPAGFTSDASYVAKGPIGDVAARFAIFHKEEAGTALPEPDITHLADKGAVATPCPGWASDIAQKEFVRGAVAHFRCAKGPFGGAVAATLRKEERIYELLCIASGDKGAEACVKVLGQLRPN
jgi:hypothetical protein